MTSLGRKLQKIGSAAFGFVAVVLLAFAILWPSSVAAVLRSRLAVSLIAVWSGSFAVLLHPDLSAGLAQGFREFRKAADQVAREILGDDNDDGPHAA